MCISYTLTQTTIFDERNTSKIYHEAYVALSRCNRSGWVLLKSQRWIFYFQKPCKDKYVVRIYKKKMR